MSVTSQTEPFFALELGKLLDEHRGVKVMVLDMRPLDFWTDFFIIATATSGTHLTGLERHIRDFVLENGLEILRRSGKSDDWHLIDLGSIIIHLMSAEIRSFYELERLWGAAPLIYQGKETTAGDYSSKSS